MEVYKVKRVDSAKEICVSVPGSKSITNRALLMAAMAEGETVLKGIQFSEDASYFLEALKELGFQVTVQKADETVVICGCGGKVPKEQAKIYVGSAGTAARFLTAFVAMQDGCYHLDSSEQMKKRPMKELLLALEELGAEFTWMEEEYSFPMQVKGIGKNTVSKKISLNIDRSSQFLSALLMTAPLKIPELTIELTGKRSARSYVEMTEQMMKQFGHPGVKRISEDCYQVSAAKYESGNYQIEPDVSAACYFYAAVAVTGGKAIVKHMRQDSLQGDMKFIDILVQMGCKKEWIQNKEGVLQLQVTGPEDGRLKGIEAVLSDFSDQTLTLAAIAPYADSVVTIRGVGHIRGQESDRLMVICTELERMGVQCEMQEDGVVIYPSQPKGAMIETYEDHRVAMAFAVTGLRADGIQIANPQCCKKTFAEYFEVFDKAFASV